MPDPYQEPSPIIVALDFDTASAALGVVSRLGHDAKFYKLGMQLLVAEGPCIVRDLVEMGKSVFLDLKLHEIPNSVSAGVRVAGKLGASMVTVHASAGSAVLEAAAAAASTYPDLSVIALTVITSLKDEDLPEIGVTSSVHEQVVRLARMSAEAGCHGVVASAWEAEYLKDELPRDYEIITPGVQLLTSAPTDQARVASPHQAAEAGATRVIVGRAITRAEAPQKAFTEALKSYEAGRAGHERASLWR